jgi:NAD-specific glutamate dehydrogenase
MAERSDFDIDQGSNVVITMDLANKDRSPYNMVNHLVFAQMKLSYLHDSTQATKFTPYYQDAPNGIIQLILTNEQTDALDYRKPYYYDVEVHHYDSNQELIIERILEGTITVKPSVTK